MPARRPNGDNAHAVPRDAPPGETMFETIGFAIIALLAFGVNDVIFKRAAQHGATAHHMMMVLALTMLPVIVVYGLLTRTLAAHPGAWWGAVGGCFTYFAFYNFSRALHAGAMSVAVPVFRLFFVGTAVLSIVFLGESVSFLKVVGLAAGVLAVWLLLAPGMHATVEIPRHAVARILVAALLGSFPFFFFKKGLVEGASMPSVIAYQAATVSAIAAIGVFIREKRINAPAPALRHGIAFGVIQAFGFGILMQGMMRGEASILVPIAQLSFLVSAVVGIVWWQEALTARKVTGIVAAVGAVALLGLAARLPA